MIEIAIAVGVIGFALVAVIGILPRGMGVQKDNREDTIISQDAPYFINAIRNGEQRTNNNILANYIEVITVSSTNPAPGFTNDYYNPALTTGAPNNYLTNDKIAVGLLSTPEIDLRNQNSGYLVVSSVSAIVRAMTGSAVQQNGANSLTAFRYQLIVENVPWTSYSMDSTNYLNYAGGSYESNSRYVRLAELPYLTNNLREVRLRFAWPAFPTTSNTYTIGPNRQTYRTLINSHLELTNNPFGTFSWFFRPNSFTNNILSF